MPEGRAIPYKFMPRPGQELSVTFGEPIPAERLSAALQTTDVLTREAVSNNALYSGVTAHGTGWMANLVTTRPIDTHPTQSTTEVGSQSIGQTTNVGTGGKEKREQLVGTEVDEQLAHVRAEVTRIVQHAVEELGRKLVGDQLGKVSEHKRA